MAGSTETSSHIGAFFARCGLSPSPARSACHDFAAARFPPCLHVARPAPSQGYCSYTLLVNDNLVLQFRPEHHRLKMGLATLAVEVFDDLAPATEYLGTVEVRDEPTGKESSRQPPAGQDKAVGGLSDLPVLHAYSLKRIPGVSLAGYRCGRDRNLRDNSREGLVRSFARLWARSWADAVPANSGFEKGLVGTSMRRRLEMMMVLPEHFRPVVKSTLLHLDKIMLLPWVLSHGDLVPANIMVDPRTGHLSGLIDWAEAERLPFGVGLYGLEELLGEDVPGVGFRYYADAEQLRHAFWGELYAAIPDLGKTASVSLLQAAQVAGILLWHGIAFDDGSLDRVVQEGRDEAELQRLHSFLLEPLYLQDAPDQRDWTLTMFNCKGALGRWRRACRFIFAKQCSD